MGAHGKIFISYRREDAPGDARGICDRLGRSFGAANVFMDVDRLLAGQRFDRELDKALAKCDVLVAVIGSRWMELLSDYLQRSKRDYVRDEIAAALKRDIIVIPVMIGREANMPPLPLADDLPENIRELVLYQKHNIAHETFGRDAADLVMAIKTALRDRRGPRPWRTIGAAAIIGLLLAGAALGYWMDILPRIGSGVPKGNIVGNPTAATVSTSDAASKKAEEDARQEAQADAKAADAAARKKAEDEARRKAELDTKAADDAAKKKAADDAARKAAADEAARKAIEQAKSASVTDCDRLAASPYDDDRPNGVAGVVDPLKINLAATAACNDAMRGNPAATRFIYQAGRSAVARKDYARAAELFRQAVGKGSAAALADLGDLYMSGLGVTQDSVEARALYEKGVERKSSAAMTAMGALYEKGLGVPRVFSWAYDLYGRAAALGNADAMTSLGNLYYLGHGVAQDYPVARSWYEKAAALGNVNAILALGGIYENGGGVAQDFAEAQKWYEKAATLGNAAAMYNLGSLSENGRGIPVNLGEARKWYEKAAQQGHTGAMRSLGWLYSSGGGVARDYSRARSLYEQAAALGDAAALAGLSHLCGQAFGLTDFETRACHMHAAELGSVSSMFELGVIFENGRDVDKDTGLARKWYQKAADAGSDKAKEKLKALR